MFLVASFSSAWLRCTGRAELCGMGCRKFWCLYYLSRCPRAPALSHARMAPSSVAASHEVHAVEHYADLSIEPGDVGGSHAAVPGGMHHDDDGLCNKCCSACLGASLIPTTPMVAVILSGPYKVLFTGDEALVERPVPTEPGIPKPR